MLLGSVITAAGLQFFLLPNHLLDGGVTGISIILAKLTSWPLALFIISLNIPFVFFGFKKFGRGFAVYSTVGIIMFASLTVKHVGHGFTDVPLLAAIFGGLIMGIGIGLVIRYGGILDGTDTIAVLIDRETVFSVSEAIMVINGAIIALAGFVFGPEQAMYSLIAYYVAHKAINTTVDGINESRSLWVVSNDVRLIGNKINVLIEEPVTYFKESSPLDREPHGIMLVVITRFQEQKIKATIREIDPMAFIMINSAHEVLGKVSEGSLYRELPKEVKLKA